LAILFWMRSNVSLNRSDTANARLAQFLDARRAGTSVTAIALEWGLSRACVSRKVRRQAVLLVTDRVLARNQRGIPSREPVALPARGGPRPAVQHSA